MQCAFPEHLPGALPSPLREAKLNKLRSLPPRGFVISLAESQDDKSGKMISQNLLENFQS